MSREYNIVLTDGYAHVSHAEWRLGTLLTYWMDDRMIYRGIVTRQDIDSIKILWNTGKHIEYTASMMQYNLSREQWLVEVL